MKKIFSLYIANLNDKQHSSYRELAVAVCSLYTVAASPWHKIGTLAVGGRS